jgi:YD repeat-containing protein
MTYRKLVLSGLFSSKGMLAPITPSSDCCAETLLSKVATVSIQVFEIPNLHSQHFLGTKQVSANLNWNPNGTLSYLSITDPLNPLNQQTCSTYSYDDFGRLTQVTCGTTWAQTFTYDSFGNIKKTEGNQMWMPTYDSANNNRYQTGGGISYDLNGNLLSDTFNTYAWDGNWGNPASVNGNALVYDALGRMVENTSSAGTREYIYGPGGSQPLAQMNGRRSPC